jgi:ribosomal protein L40E
MAGLVCGHCGATNPAGSRFCASCDGFLDWEGEPEAVDTPAAAPPAGPVPAPQRPAPDPYQPPPVPAERPAPPPRPSESFPDPARSRTQRTEPLDVGRPAAAVDPDPGILHCPNCGTGNPPGRRFCRRCGEWVVNPGPPVELGSTTRRRGGKRPWWKPFGAEKPAYTKSLTGTTIAFRTATAVAAVVIGSLLLGLFGFNPIGRARDYVQHLLGSGRIEGVTATADPAEPVVDEHPPEWAVDDIQGRGWTTQWVGVSPAGPDDACAGEVRPAVSQKLTLKLASPASVREIGVEGGLPEKDPQRVARYRPRTLQLQWEGGGCQTVRLKDEPGLQRFYVRQKGDVAGVTITVVGGYQPASGGPGGDRLDISEITLWQR